MERDAPMPPELTTPANPLRAAVEARIGQTMHESLSPVGRWLNGTLLEVTDDGMAAAYLVRPEMTNPAGVLHGGIAATMMDDLLGGTVMVLSGGRYHASVNLHVDYLAPARSGETVTARARIVRQGKRLVHAECSLTNAAGDLLARATTNLLALGE
jgi:uncharacterized protein (TIGR00369 family)